MRRLGLALAGAALSISGLTACGSSHPTYAPSAYGENGRCYFIDDPYEVAQLQHAGLCPATWTPYPMPVYWHQRYDSYYSSGAYVNRYVQPTHVVIVKRRESTFKRQYASAIKTAAKAAAYTKTKVTALKPPKSSTTAPKTSTGKSGGWRFSGSKPTTTRSSGRR